MTCPCPEFATQRNVRAFIRLTVAAFVVPKSVMLRSKAAAVQDLVDAVHRLVHCLDAWAGYGSLDVVPEKVVYFLQFVSSALCELGICHRVMCLWVVDQEVSDLVVEIAHCSQMCKFCVVLIVSPSVETGRVC